MDQFYYFFPPNFVYYPENTQLKLSDQQLQECDKPWNEIATLQEKLLVLKDKIEELNEENTELKKRVKPKRKYSKRRLHLRKDFKCSIRDCRNSYSSKIALHSHIAKKHKNFNGKLSSYCS